MGLTPARVFFPACPVPSVELIRLTPNENFYPACQFIILSHLITLFISFIPHFQVHICDACYKNYSFLYFHAHAFINIIN